LRPRLKAIGPEVVGKGQLKQKLLEWLAIKYLF
jgi:hypothetical protein